MTTVIIMVLLITFIMIVWLIIVIVNVLLAPRDAITPASWSVVTGAPDQPQIGRIEAMM